MPRRRRTEGVPLLPAWYEPGDTYIDVLELVADIIMGRHVYWRHKLQNAGWMVHTPLAQLQLGVSAGVYRRANRIEISNEEE